MHLNPRPLGSRHKGRESYGRRRGGKNSKYHSASQSGSAGSYRCTNCCPWPWDLPPTTSPAHFLFTATSYAFPGGLGWHFLQALARSHSAGARPLAANAPAFTSVEDEKRKPSSSLLRPSTLDAGMLTPAGRVRDCSVAAASRDKQPRRKGGQTRPPGKDAGLLVRQPALDPVSWQWEKSVARPYPGIRGSEFQSCPSTTTITSVNESIAQLLNTLEFRGGKSVELASSGIPVGAYLCLRASSAWLVLGQAYPQTTSR